MKRVLVTGATGFVGANLVRRLLHEGHEVHLALRPQYSKWRIEEISNELDLHIVDLAEIEATEQMVRQVRPEWIFHLAAHGAYSWQNDLQDIVRTNLSSTINLLDACARQGFDAFVNTGSSSEYGFKDHPPKEDEHTEPNSYYAVTKASATMFCRYFAQSKKLHVPTLRLYSVYGAYEEPNRLLPTIIVRGLNGQYPSLVNPDVARDYVYIDDVCDAYLLAASNTATEPGAVYNVGSAVQTSLKQVAQTAKQAFALTAEPQWGSMPNRSWDTSVWISDNAKLKSELGWSVKNNFDEGFLKMVDWFKANPDKLSFYQSRIAS